MLFLAASLTSAISLIHFVESLRDVPQSLESGYRRLSGRPEVQGDMDNACTDRSLTLIAMPGFPLVEPGADLGEVICGIAQTRGPELVDHDVVVVAQKVVSKAEGHYVDLASVKPGPRALALAVQVQKDPRLVEVILAESRRVLRHRPGVLIVEHKLGFVVANAGVDQSNVDPAKGAQPVLLLPKDPDASAQRLHQLFRQRLGKTVGVVINDSFGRAWRLGTVGVALGAAGLPALMNLRGRPDLYGRRLQVSEIAFADEIAAAASLLMGQANEATPVVVLRGLAWPDRALPAAALMRSPEEDLFR
jgi:coenzyme F420-0:L-glutamate ligase/coenzyme F420-1:gamma-L-glutamate ligase